MGRTLHYQVLNQDRLTDAHLESLLAVSEAYNTGQFAKVWTCENFFLDPLASLPNWKAGHDWKSYEQRYTELEAQGFSSLAIRRWLIEEGVAKRYYDEVRGFCKVGGNEFNALLVYSALLKITELTPARITLDDEGELLLASLILQRGKAKLDLKDMETDWRYWDKQGFLAEDKYGCRTKLEAQQALFPEFAVCRQRLEFAV